MQISQLLPLMTLDAARIEKELVLKLISYASSGDGKNDKQ